MDRAYKGDELLKISEIADWLNLGRQTVYLAIRNQKLKSDKIKNKFYAKFADVENWQKRKYSRDYCTENGERLFDPEKNRWSVKQLSKILEVAEYRIYYLISKGELPFKRVGATYLIEADPEYIRSLYFSEHPRRNIESPRQMSLV